MEQEELQMEKDEARRKPKKQRESTPSYMKRESEISQPYPNPKSTKTGKISQKQQQTQTINPHHPL